MTKLFISDIDGCISQPYQSMRADGVAALTVLAQQGGALGSSAVYPALSLCSGRPMPYVECLTQALGLQMPVLFESGGGIFDPVNARITWSPHLTPDVVKQVREVTRWFETECVPGTLMVVDYAKRAHAGIIGPDPAEIQAAIPKVEAFVRTAGLAFDVLPTHLSIDVVPKGITKETGMQWLLDSLGLSFDTVAYIGDSLGDLAALKLAGSSFAPENAKSVVKEAVDYVVPAEVEGVLVAIKMCIARNQQTLEIEELKY